MLNLSRSSLKAQSPLLLAGLSSCLAFLLLALNSQAVGQLSLSVFFISMSLALLSSIGLFWILQKQGRQVSVVGLILFAVLFRLMGVFAVPPLEDDVYRYLWDAYMWLEIGSPYLNAPADFFDSDTLSQPFEVVLGHINHPDIPTVYGPLNQWVFGLAYIVAPAQTWPLQLFYGLVDLCLILVLLRLASPNMVLLYAWSPLVVKEFAFTAHPDVLGVLALVLAYYAYRQKAFYRAAVCLALAAGVKLFALVAVPLLLGWRWRAWSLFIATCCILSLPFGLQAAWFPVGLSAMAGDWLFNSPIFVLVGSWLNPLLNDLFNQAVSFNTLKTFLALLFVAGWGAYYIRVCLRYAASFYTDRFGAVPQPSLRLDLIFAAMLICSPVINPWYLVWVLPFAVVHPNVWPWVASGAILLAYASGINLQDSSLLPYEIPEWVVFIEFALIALAGLFAKKIKPLLYCQ